MITAVLSRTVRLITLLVHRAWDESMAANHLKKAKSWVECLLSDSGFCVEHGPSTSFPQAPESEMLLLVKNCSWWKGESASVSCLMQELEELKLLTDWQNFSSQHWWYFSREVGKSRLHRMVLGNSFCWCAYCHKSWPRGSSTVAVLSSVKYNSDKHTNVFFSYRK